MRPSGALKRISSDFRNSVVGWNPISFGAPNVASKSEQNASSSITEPVSSFAHIYDFRQPNEVVQKPKFIWTFRATTLMKGRKPNLPSITSEIGVEVATEEPKPNLN